MTTKRGKTGNRGEALAVQHLQQKGYTILAQNWRCRLGELDIVAQDHEYVIFVEVKTTTSTLDEAFAHITPAKQTKLLRAIHTYLAQAELPEDTLWRVDAIGIVLSTAKQPQIEHVEDALGW